MSADTGPFAEWATHVHPFDAGQHQQRGRAVVESHGKFYVRKVFRDQSTGSAWQDKGPWLGHPWQPTGPIICNTHKAALLASAY